MKSAPGSVILAAALAASLLAPVGALAQESGFYLGGAIGQATLREWCDTGAAPAGFSLPACDDKTTAWKILGGYRFNRYLAVEGTYIDWGEVTGTVRAPNGALINVSAEQTSLGVAAVGSLALGPQFSVFGKAGFLATEQDVRVGNLSTTGDETEFHFGFGAKFAFTPSWALRAEWERTDKLEADLLSVGVEYRF